MFPPSIFHEAMGPSRRAQERERAAARAAAEAKRADGGAAVTKRIGRSRGIDRLRPIFSFFRPKHGGLWGMGIGRIVLQCVTPRSVPGVLTQKESPTRPIDRRAPGPHACRANVDISDLQGHLQRAWHLQPYSNPNGKQGVGRVSDAMATKAVEPPSAVVSGYRYDIREGAAKKES